MTLLGFVLALGINVFLGIKVAGGMAARGGLGGRGVLRMRRRSGPRRVGEASPEAIMAAADFADLVSLAVRAGATPRQALLLHAADEASHCRISLVGRLVSLGFTLEEAVVRARASSVESLPLDEVLDTIAFSTGMGTALAPALDRQSAGLRNRALSSLEAQAGKAPVSMLFPLVLFLLPEILILLVGGAGQELLSLLAQ